MCGKRMCSADKYMWLCNEKRMKDKILRFQNLSKHGFVEAVEKENADLTAHRRDIFDNLIGLCLAQAEIIFVLSVMPDQIHEGVDCERVVLCGDAELLFPTGSTFVTVF